VSALSNRLSGVTPIRKAEAIVLGGIFGVPPSTFLPEQEHKNGRG
jgi:hypothetical protein